MADERTFRPAGARRRWEEPTEAQKAAFLRANTAAAEAIAEQLRLVARSVERLKEVLARRRRVRERADGLGWDVLGENGQVLSLAPSEAEAREQLDEIDARAAESERRHKAIVQRRAAREAERARAVREVRGAAEARARRERRDADAREAAALSQMAQAQINASRALERLADAAEAGAVQKGGARRKGIVEKVTRTTHRDAAGRVTGFSEAESGELP